PDRDPTPAWLESDQSAAGRGDPDRAAEVAPVGEADHSGGGGGGASARGPAGGKAELPGVAGGAVARVVGDWTEPEFGRVRLADDDRAGGPQAPYVGAVVVGDPVPEGGAPLRGGQPLGRREQVFDPDRHAAKGPRVAGLNPVGLGQRPGAAGCYDR